MRDDVNDAALDALREPHKSIFVGERTMIEEIAELLNWYGNAQPYVDWNVAGNHNIKQCRRVQAREFVSLFKEQIEKLQPLSDEEIEDVDNSLGSEDWRFGEAIAQAQLAKDKDALRGMNNG